VPIISDMVKEGHVQQRAALSRVDVKAQIRDDLVELHQQRLARGGVRREQAERRQRVAGEAQRDEDCRDGVSRDEHDVLGDLRVGDALHAAENRVHEHNRRADEEACGGVRLEEACEGHTHACHLPNDVSD
jgi:hypothetical protein